MWYQTSWIVRFCAWRIQCLILAKVCSIGLRSGEYGGRYQSLALERGPIGLNRGIPESGLR